MEVNKRKPKVKPTPNPKPKDPFQIIRDEIKLIRDDLLIINPNLPRCKNPPPPVPPPDKVIIQPASQPMKVQGLYGDADDYFKSYFKSKHQEDEMPIHYSILALQAVILILLVYLCIKVSN